MKIELNRGALRKCAFNFENKEQAKTVMSQLYEMGAKWSGDEPDWECWINWVIYLQPSGEWEGITATLSHSSYSWYRGDPETAKEWPLVELTPVVKIDHYTIHLPVASEELIKIGDTLYFKADVEKALQGIPCW